MRVSFFCWLAFIYFLYCPIFRSLHLSVLLHLSYMNNESLLHFQFFVFWFLKGLNLVFFFFFKLPKMWMNPPVTHCRPTIRSGCWHVRTLLYVNSKDGRRTGRSGSSKPSLALNAQATSSESIMDVVCSTRTSAPQFFQGSSFEFAVCYKREDCYSVGCKGVNR